ncbi:MAG: nicotinamide-nucleotide amidohydrolase family protein [Candidatus Methanomethylophilaceae archaeon]|nr:nicotinamide-nucleotide amidohydrolase family protein [Candidatus Methanomethylophilaceae archaeon]
MGLLREAGKTVCTAESCTGGLIGAAITSVPGSSDVFQGGVIAYSNDVKMKVLGVKEQTLMDHGAVSEDTAREMAAGARSFLGTDTAIAVTGIAGPGGAVPGKPVGLVYIAVADGPRVVVSRNVFGGGREDVRSSTVSTALELLEELLKGVL